MKKLLRNTDKILFVLIAILCVMGLIMIYSASMASSLLRYNVATNHFFLKQFGALFLGLFLGVIILCIPTSKYKPLAYLGLICSFGALILIFSMGKSSNNAQSWFSMGFASIQPSEFVKTVVIVFSAVFYNDLNNIKNCKYWGYLIPLGITAILFVLVAKQPDLGSGIIILTIGGMLFFSTPAIHKNLKKIITWSIIPVIIIGTLLINYRTKIFSSEKLSRFNFTKPCTRYKDDTGYQVCNGMIAISNGGLFGLGLGKSTQKYLYLPESHTDFIFPILCEELGSIIGCLVIIIYGVILYRLFAIAKKAGNLRNSLIAYGTFWYFTLHILINLGGVLAIIPLTGVPLPFLSYGGSFVLNAIVLLFMVQRVNIENHRDKLDRDLYNYR